MIKVLHITNVYLPYIGGSSIRLSNLIERLVNSCEMHVLVSKDVLCDSGNLPNYEVINNIHIHRVNKRINLVKAIRDISRKHAINIIHAHNPRFSFLSYLSFVEVPIIVEIHAIKDFGFIKRFLSNIMYKASSRVIVLSKSMKEEIERKSKISPDKIKIIYNGIDIDMFNPLSVNGNSIRSLYGIYQDTVIGYLGTFYLWQGVIDLIKAFYHVIQRYESAKLLMVGDGPELENVKNLIRELNIENKVILTGKVQPDLVPVYFDAMDIITIPRPSVLATETAIPLKLIEAMAMKKPIVATRLKALLEVLDDGVNSILAKPGEPQDIARCILEVLYNKELKETLSENARKAVEERFSWSASASALLDCYLEVMNSCK